MEEKLNSTESIPKQFIETARDSHKSLKRDSNYDYVRDAQGNFVYEIDEKEVKNSIKNLARHFANHGVDIEQINFDDYLVEGVTLDKIPKKALTVIQIKNTDSYSPLNSFYVFDKRSSSGRENPLWEAGSRNMYHSKRGRRVDVGRIPDYQFLQAAKNVWVIPEEVLNRDVYSVRNKRRSQQVGTVKRYKTLPYDHYRYSDHRILDKSGYIIDPDEIAKKLKNFKEKKELSSAGSYLALAEKEVEAVVSEYNKMASLVLKVASNQLAKGKLNLDLSNLAKCNSELNGIITNFISDAESVDKGQSYSKYGYDRNLARLKDFKNTYVWRDLKNTYDLLLSDEALDSALEGRGCKVNRSLQATEGYFIDSKILAAFGEDD